ncbi:hypothetical protein [Streptomyces acidiscabies]|uniref:Uncharacterized protein n=1 Tax=Streptomyces acidiscabies TaxID=42234 RepID=A0ABU4M9C6_9ACTN|nr:hypothetical protein [Streptomyces acidiscabies]MDX3024084.1 hypothetical protein [Streptomyces acidiscabies]
MTPTHARRGEPRRRRTLLTAAYLAVLLATIVALVWGIAASGRPS